MSIIDRLIARAERRGPDFVIGGHERPYLLRWWLIPRNPIFNVYLHKFMRSDDDRALHDHPWLFNVSRLLRGPYIEWVPSASGNPHRPVPRFLKAGDWRFRWGPAPHRVQLHKFAGKEQPVWTLFITGPRVRQWGFYCPQGWMHWKRFTAADDPGAVGKGCEA
jgi:hypothetical protein